MRVLSALVLTHCFGCVIPEDSDEEITVKRSYIVTSKKNASDISAIITSQERYGGHTRALFSNTDMRKLLKDRASHCKGLNTGYHDWVHSRVCVRKLIPPKSLQPYSRYAKSRKFRGRKLLNHGRENRKQSRNIEKGENGEKARKAGKRSKTMARFKSTTLRKRKHNTEAEDNDKDNKSDSGEPWDNWSNWSTCSTTCGHGRKVRWRHCTVDKCVKGLKKAQIKSCRLKDCDKGILGWLGIKS